MNLIPLFSISYISFKRYVPYHAEMVETAEIFSAVSLISA